MTLCLDLPTSSPNNGKSALLPDLRSGIVSSQYFSYYAQLQNNMSTDLTSAELVPVPISANKASDYKKTVCIMVTAPLNKGLTW